MRLLYDASRAEGLRLYAPGDVCKHPGGRTVKAMSVFRESERSYVLCAGGAAEAAAAERRGVRAEERAGGARDRRRG